MEIEKVNQPKIYEKMDFESGGIIKNASEQALKGKVSAESDLQVSNKWDKIYKIGPGLANLGNTCFFNSVLQCLTYTPSLANYLLSGEHKKVCQRKESFCAICLLEQHVEQCFAPNRVAVVQPRKIIQNMRYINKKFKLGRQDDSHELLRLFIESMQKSALDFRTKVDQKQEEATPIYKMLGGKLKSQIECSVCNYRSENFETFYDLSLECKETVYKSMDLFFRKETLQGNNKYRCSKCKKLVEAQKGYLIQQLPNILTLQIKRFNNFMMKINTPTQFPAEIDMSKYIQQAIKKPEMYDLYGVLVHVGGGLHFGHYYCFVKNSNEMWYCMNDSSVAQRSFSEISKERPYLLFYAKRETITKPKRKSSADLSNLTNLQNENTLNQNGQALENIQEASQDEINQQKKSLTDEYKDISKTEQSKEYMKQLEEIFAIKKNKKEGNNEKQIPIVNKQVSTEASTPLEEGKEEKQKLMNVHSVQKEEQKMDIEINGKEEEEEENKESDEAYYQILRDRMNNKVVRLKKIKKLRYLSDSYMRQQIRSEMLRSSQTFRSSQQKSESSQTSVEENKFQNEIPKQVVVKSVELLPKQVEAKSVEILPSNKNSGSLLKALHQKDNVNASSILQNGQQSEDQNKVQTPLNLSSLDALSKSEITNQWRTTENDKLSSVRKLVIESNKSIFEYSKKEKDEYDVEYDKGHLKKIKKKKDKQRIDFNRLQEQISKQKNKSGFKNFKNNKNN